MARAIYVTVPQAEVSKAVNSAAAHADAYAPSQLVELDGGKVGILFISSGATNPESDSSFFTGLSGEIDDE